MGDNDMGAGLVKAVSESVKGWRVGGLERVRSRGSGASWERNPEHICLGQTSQTPNTKKNAPAAAAESPGRTTTADTTQRNARQPHDNLHHQQPRARDNNF